MKANKKFISLKSNDRGYAAVIGGIIAILLTILVCVMIYWKMAPAISDAAGTGALMVKAHSAMNNTNTTSNSIFTLAPIVCIVLIAGVILGIVMRFGGGKMDGV